ncbi:hypothetical protein HGM15179_001162, partial [Zosterops borbonicus]
YPCGSPPAAQLSLPRTRLCREALGGHSIGGRMFSEAQTADFHRPARSQAASLCLHLPICQRGIAMPTSPYVLFRPNSYPLSLQLMEQRIFYRGCSLLRPE